MRLEVQVIVGVPTETYPGDRTVALVPAVAPMLAKIGLEVLFQQGAGVNAGFADDAESLSGIDVERDAVNGAHNARGRIELDVQVAHLEQRLRH